VAEVALGQQRTHGATLLRRRLPRPGVVTDDASVSLRAVFGRCMEAAVWVARGSS
jgi:hypothetical protein